MNEKSLNFHIQGNDYFGTLATILDLMRQNLEKDFAKEESLEQFARLREELMYLQNGFKIVPK